MNNIHNCAVCFYKEPGKRNVAILFLPRGGGGFAGINIEMRTPIMKASNLSWLKKAVFCFTATLANTRDKTLELSE